MTWRPAPEDRGRVAPLVMAGATAQALLVIFGPSLGAVSDDLGADVGAVGQARTVTAAVALVASLVLLRQVRSLGVRRVAVGGAGTAILSAALVPAATGLGAYLALHVVVGLALAGLLTTAFAGLAGFTGPARARAAGRVTAAGGAGWVVGSPAAGLLTEHLSWRSTHALPALLALVTLLLARHCTGPVAPRTRGYAAPLAPGPGLLVAGGARRWVVAETLANVGWTSVLTFVGGLMVVGLGVPEGLAGWLIAVGAACFVVASFSGGRLAGAAEPRDVVAVTTGLLGVGVAALFATAVLPPGWLATTSAAGAFAATAVAAGLRIPATSVLGMAQRPDRPESMMAARTAAMQVGYLLGAGLSGALVSTAGWAALGPVLAATLGASALLTTRLARPGHATTTASSTTDSITNPTTSSTTADGASAPVPTTTTAGGHA